MYCHTGPWTLTLVKQVVTQSCGSNLDQYTTKIKDKIIWALCLAARDLFWNHLEPGNPACLFQRVSELACLGACHAFLHVNCRFIHQHFGALPASCRGWLCNWRRSSPRADSPCCLTWFGSIKEANRLLTPLSIPPRFSHAHKPISAAVINTGLIIVSPSQSRVPRSTPYHQSPKLALNWMEQGHGHRK